MYKYIENDISSGRCRLESEYVSKSVVPLLKDKYSGERKTAKTLNFSLAYGKTIFGLAKDFDINIREAKIILNKWYNERQVKEWQEYMYDLARYNGYVPTLIGR